MFDALRAGNGARFIVESKNNLLEGMHKIATEAILSRQSPSRLALDICCSDSLSTPLSCQFFPVQNYDKRAYSTQAYTISLRRYKPDWRILGLIQ